MTMAKYVCGPRRSVQTVPASSYNAGDVIVQGNLTLIADADNPLSTTLSITQGALYIGGIYQVAADAAYTNGTFVYWNATNSQITTVQVPGTTTPFGTIVAGPAGLLSDGGPTGNNSLCFVDHIPFPPVKPAIQSINAAGTALANAAALIEGINIVTGANNSAAVRLPVASGPGAKCTVKSITSGSILVVFPPAGGTVNEGAANAAGGNCANLALREYYALNTIDWYSQESTIT